MLVPQTSGKRALGRGAAGAKDLGQESARRKNQQALGAGAK